MFRKCIHCRGSGYETEGKWDGTQVKILTIEKMSSKRVHFLGVGEYFFVTDGKFISQKGLSFPG
jgi:hypothetical protein